jgi:hypothetical protein
MIVTKSTIFAKRVLHLIEEESAYYDLRLNKGKCNFISFNYKANITFKNGDVMKRTGEATYLGATITQQVDPNIETRNRISATMPVLKKLDTFWNKAKCNKKWQIQVLNAVIVSKLTYGLETIEPTEGALKTLNAFHLKGLRKILNMKTTFVDRANTNEAVYRKAFQVLQTENEKKPPRLQKAKEHMTKQVRPISEGLEAKKLSLLGHVIRREFHHPTFQVTFATPAGTEIATPLLVKRSPTKRRKGRPRLNWAEENMSRAWQAINALEEDELPLQAMGRPYDNDDKLMNQIIVRQAKAYKPPFEGLKAKEYADFTT